jgi:hypothetical protein
MSPHGRLRVRLLGQTRPSTSRKGASENRLVPDTTLLLGTQPPSQPLAFHCPALPCLGHETGRGASHVGPGRVADNCPEHICFSARHFLARIQLAIALDQDSNKHQCYGLLWPPASEPNDHHPNCSG